MQVQQNQPYLGLWKWLPAKVTDKANTIGCQNRSLSIELAQRQRQSRNAPKRGRHRQARGKTNYRRRGQIQSLQLLGY